jgi:P pilus assembly chaperone PapD
LLVAAVALAVSSTVGTGGISAATMERGIQGELADDRTAYLGFEQTPENTTNDTTDLEVTVTNRFPGGTELTAVEVTVNETTVDLADGGTVSPGEEVTYTFTAVSCGDRTTVVAVGSDMSVRLDRSVACE